LITNDKGEEGEEGEKKEENNNEEGIKTCGGFNIQEYKILEKLALKDVHEKINTLRVNKISDHLRTIYTFIFAIPVIYLILKYFRFLLEPIATLYITSRVYRLVSFILLMDGF